MTAPILSATPDTIARAADILRRGGLVAMPTETVYGLAADASNPRAVARLYQAKGRPRFNPLIAHVASLDEARREGTFNRTAETLAAKFWPGPLTLVLPVVPQHSVCDLARAGLDSIALRRPDHPVAQALLEHFGGPLVAPSANPSGRISPTRAEHVAADMAGLVDLIIDGGPCRAGIESTIIDVRTERPMLLRPGSLKREALEQIIPSLGEQCEASNQPRSPGQLLRHYAPNAALRLNAKAPREGELYLGFGDCGGDLNLSPTGDLGEAAANLFAHLRALDQQGRPIAIAPIPMSGLGEAINDRLTRAAKRD